MPTYEYKCLSCGVQFDAFQKMSESPLENCIECRGKVRRVVSGGSGLIFKGSGFYITDYAKGKSGVNDSSSDKQSAKPSAKPKKAKSATAAEKGSSPKKQ